MSGHRRERLSRDLRVHRLQQVAATNNNHTNDTQAKDCNRLLQQRKIKPRQGV